MQTTIWPLVIAVVLLGPSTWSQTRILDEMREESSVTYRLSHPLHHIESTSNDMHSKIEVDEAKKEIKRVAAQVEVMTFSSGNSNRDSHAMEVIDAISYPDSRFSSSAVRQTGDSVYVTGMLTFHGVTKEIVIAAVTSWQSDKVVVTGGFDVSLTAFNIDRPSLLMIPVDDTLRFSLLAVYRLEQPHL